MNQKFRNFEQKLILNLTQEFFLSFEEKSILDKKGRSIYAYMRADHGKIDNFGQFLLDGSSNTLDQAK